MRLLQSSDALTSSCRVESFAAQLAYALNKHRGCGDGEKLKGALLNVIDHAYGRHGNCLKYFECPCARGKRWGSAYNPERRDGLNAMPGGKEAEEVLRREWAARLTAPGKLERLLHGWATQRNEAFNSLHVSLHPKRMHLALTDTGEARLKLAVARFNSGCLQSTREVLQRLGVEQIGAQAERALGALDQKRMSDAKRMREPEQKAKRRERRKRRKVRDAAKPGQAGTYAAGVGLDADPNEGMSDGMREGMSEGMSDCDE